MSSSISNSKRFSIGFITMFMVGAVVFVIGSEIIVRTTVVPHSTFDDITSRLHSSNKPFAGFADSRGDNGFVTHDQFENFSTAGDNLITIVEKAHFFAKRPTSKGVIIQADPHHFASYRLSRNQSLMRSELFDPEKPWLQFYRPVYRQYLLNYWKSLILSFLFPSPRDAKNKISNADIRFSDLSVYEADKKASIRAGLQLPVNDVTKTHYAKTYTDVIQKLKETGIDVCLVSFPVSSNYLRISKETTSYQQGLEFYKTLAENVGVKYLNFTSAYDNDVFLDPDHLNITGAEMFTNNILHACFGYRP
ncbi:MAG: hypothetical protein OQK24_01355 [Magnetovibrio sp.]|nr:hypothetical protein [Magnetovibrio sp.]